MPTIREHILDTRVQFHRERLAKAVRAFAPITVIEYEREMLAAAESGNIERLPIGAPEGQDAAEIMAREYSRVTLAPRRSGKTCFVYSTDRGAVRYYPAARRGPFITAVEG